MTNEIHNLKTDVATRSYGETPRIIIGLNIADLDTVPAFVTEVAERIKIQRMCSPLDTSVLFVTLIGSLTATRFKELWLVEVKRDEILSFFMAQMKEASVLHGKKDGTIIEHISLFEDDRSA
jgi:hypothetical protein